MGVRVIAGEDYAALYDSVRMTAFGPVFSDCELFATPGEAARDFLDWWFGPFLDGKEWPSSLRDPRVRSQVDLAADKSLWLQARQDEAVNAPKREPLPRHVDHFTNTEEDAAKFHAAFGPDYPESP